MKTLIKNLFIAVVLINGFGFMLAGRMTAQTFTTLHTFTAASSYLFITNSDGAIPYAGLISSSNTLYGTAFQGGSSAAGTVFAVNTDGTGFTNLYSFTGGSDGGNPYARLILSSNTLYGTASIGGSSRAGTVFAINTDGTGFTNLYSFKSIGANHSIGQPRGGLVLSGNTLYGTMYKGNGGVFAVNTDGTGFTNLYTFTGGNDGYGPRCGLVLSGNTLYGTASEGGSAGWGTVFAVNTDSTGFTNLYTFTGGSDGGDPFAGLILSGSILYGTASGGGTAGWGSVFAINTNGTGFTNLYNFTGGSDGADLYGGLILSGNTLYGVAYDGGGLGNGTVFAVNTDGTRFTNLYNFAASSANSADVYTNNDGIEPRAALILSDNTLYGTAWMGGGSGNGTVFSLSFLPQLTITPSGVNVVLSWPTNVAGFDYSGFMLQSATNFVSPTVWSAISSVPVVVNGQKTATNPIVGTQQFFRLSHP